MKRRIAALAAAAAFSLAGAASAQALEYHVVTPPTDMSAHWLAHVERLITYQLNEQVRPRWNTPRVSFGATGTPVYFYPHSEESTYCGVGSSGCHFNGVWVEDDRGDIDDTTTSLSHEIVEQTVDPQITTFVDGYYAEPADPVEGALYEINFSKRYNVDAGVMVQDFVYPRYYQRGSGGPWDYMHAASHALALNVFGGYYEAQSNTIIGPGF